MSSTVDLRTGLGRTPDRLDYITKRTPCRAAEPGTPHPLWTAFLERITAGNPELIEFLQRYIGYCMTGVISEHVFVFAYGTGANGKGTFINTIAAIFGDYATIADMNTFIVSNQERHSTDLAKLRGARLVIAQETPKARLWDEAKIKGITGGDKLTARFMRQDFFDFAPTFKLFITGNNKPRLSNVDEAIRRRMLLVPFAVQIPKKERDPDLPEKLKAEWPAILRWCIDGCIEWQRLGLAPPEIVVAATEDYFEAEDVFGQWLEDECDVEVGNDYKWDSAAKLFQSWSAYAARNGDKPGSQTAFAETMQARGFKRCKKSGERSFSGVQLKLKTLGNA